MGAEVTTLAVGDRVAVSAVIACGNCFYCHKGKFSNCDRTNPSKAMEKTYGHRTAGLFGYGHLTGGYDGGQAEFVRVPIADVNCLKIPTPLADEKALMLCDVACTSYMAADYAEIGPGKSEVRNLRFSFCFRLGLSHHSPLDRRNLGCRPCGAPDRAVVQIPRCQDNRRHRSARVPPHPRDEDFWSIHDRHHPSY